MNEFVMEQLEGEIRKRYEGVLKRVTQACEAFGRDPGSVRVVVVTKGHPVEVVQAAINAGARQLGENYAEEAQAKILALGKIPGVKWHMIGHVQGRKAVLVSQYFSYLHSLDSMKLADRLNRFLSERGKRLPVLLEYNVSGEATKHGWPAWDHQSWTELLPEVGRILEYPCLEVRGLMTMAPLDATPNEARDYFCRLRALRDYLAGQFHQAQWDELSMGMSSDFESAIAEGATLVRIGQAILGPRPLG